MTDLARLRSDLRASRRIGWPLTEWQAAAIGGSRAMSVGYRLRLKPNGFEGFGVLSVSLEPHDQPVAEPDDDGQGEVRGETRMPHPSDKSIGGHHHVWIVSRDHLVQQEAPVL